jgi:cell wall assembly regulator SMI1
VDDILKELYKFSEEILFLGEPITDKRLLEFEKQIGFHLPVDFKYILTKHNSFSLAGTEVLGLDERFKDASLDKVFHFEHEEVVNPMFPEYVPFSPDGGGNHYCLDVSRLVDNKCPVVFWQHDYSYSNKGEVETCNDSFIDWIKEVMIGWTLEDFNYDGSERL